MSNLFVSFIEDFWKDFGLFTKSLFSIKKYLTDQRSQIDCNNANKLRSQTLTWRNRNLDPRTEKWMGYRGPTLLIAVIEMNACIVRDVNFDQAFVVHNENMEQISFQICSFSYSLMDHADVSGPLIMETTFPRERRVICFFHPVRSGDLTKLFSWRREPLCGQDQPGANTDHCSTLQNAGTVCPDVTKSVTGTGALRCMVCRIGQAFSSVRAAGFT